MLDPNDYRFCNEFYVVEKSIVVAVELKDGSSATIRIDALHALARNRYLTYSYIFEDVAMQPDHSQAEMRIGAHTEPTRTWIDFELPWTDADTADGAISEALHFLSDMCKHR